jgi:hypothetical protein
MRRRRLIGTVGSGLTGALGLAVGACGAPAANAPGRAVTPAPAPAVNIQGTVSVLSYQQTSPRYDMQQANYDAFNKEYESKGLRVDFVNPGPMANDLLLQKFITLHVAGTPMDVIEWPLLWRQLEGVITELTPYLKRDKIDEKQWIPNAINAMKDDQGRMGVDPKAFLQMGQRTRLPGWGYYLLKNWGAARTEIDSLFTEAKAGRMAVPELVQKAQDLSLQLASF